MNFRLEGGDFVHLFGEVTPRRTRTVHVDRPHPGVMTAFYIH